MNTMKLPASYAMIAEEEMTYLEGGATITASDAYTTFHYLARIFSGASSIINNIDVIYKSVLALNDLLGKMWG